jgi:hypothetical protein
LIVQSSTFTNSKAIKNGGIGYFLSTSPSTTTGLPTFQVKFSFCNFNTQYAEKENGGGFYVENF